MTNVNVCPKCKKPCEGRYREVPKGQLAKFVCIDCLPENMKPDQETKSIINAISDNQPQGIRKDQK